MGPLVFASPYILGLLAALPVIWWLLRLLPPLPRRISFPALMLLRGLAAPEKTPARTPWWMLLVRLLAAALVIFACAGPRLNPGGAAAASGTVLIAVDNDWAAARAWDVRQDALHELLRQAERSGREVILLPTAPPADGAPLQSVGPMAARAAFAAADSLKPLPWPADWKQATDSVGQLDCGKVSAAVWLNSGLGGPAALGFHEKLEACAGKNLRTLSDPETPIYLLSSPKNDGGDNSVTVTRANTEKAATVGLLALGQKGRMLARLSVSFVEGAPSAAISIEPKVESKEPLNLPPDVRNGMARLEIESQRSASTTALLDDSWRQHPVGLVGDKTEESAHSLMSGLFYIDRALKPFAELHVGALAELVKQNMAVILMPDSASLADNDIPALAEWIKKGGVLVRFAGDRLAAQQNPHELELLPVTLRTEDRAMGGALSWAAPQKLRAFPPASPFYGLAVPADVTVSRQVLAEPDAALQQKTWAALEDETPLVTAKPIGRGLSILFHVPARSEWSNLPLSGLFVEMLRRIAEMGRQVPAANEDFSSLAPLQTLDAFGDFEKPGAAVRPVERADFPHLLPGPQHPPGLYGTGGGLQRAFNLGAVLEPPTLLRGTAAESYRLTDSETDLAPLLLGISFLLLLADFVLSLWLRGIVTAWSAAGKILPILFIFAFLSPAEAAVTSEQPVELTSKTFLAYVETGNHEIDRTSQAGLEGLAQVLQQRTSIEQVGVAGVDPARDDFSFFPFVYWVLTGSSAPLSPEAAQQVNNYLHHGGMILFDFAGGEVSGTILQTVLAGVSIPPLIPIPAKHVLRHSFYLIDSFPGRQESGELWLEPEETSSYDGVATVLAGANGWAAAWALDAQGHPLFACTPGGEPQRELAYRFGVNLVMYALTGNYKSDQLHAQALLEKLGKKP